MLLYDNNLWRNDIDKVISVIPELAYLNGKSILITGATGLICSSVVDVLRRYNEVHEGNIHIYAAGRSKERFNRRFGLEDDCGDVTFVSYDATCDTNNLDFDVDYIIHGAANAFPARVMKEPVETMLGNILGMHYLLNCAKNHHTKKVLYISSSEVYGKKDNDKPFNENDYGYVDLLNPRNSYSISKRATETLCVSYAEEFGLDISIVRPGHIYGPTASQEDSRVSSAWAYTVARGEDIVMKSDGSQLRSYCYSLDCASAIIKVLIKGEPSSAYNISNCDSIITIRQLAEILAEISGSRLIIDAPSVEEKRAFNPMSNSSLTSESLEKLGWKGCFPAKTGLEHTANIIKQVYFT